MKSHTLPLICGVAVAAMCAAGISHWWSVRQFLVVMNHSPAAAARSAPPAPEPAVSAAAQQPAAAPASVRTTAAAPPAAQQKFYDALITRMESLQNQNRDLLDQLAETNRDLMKLEFRVDSHSASFRPLPVSEDQPFTSLDSDIGVLPPRAEPVLMPTQE
jgi:TolA-binding protein